MRNNLDSGATKSYRMNTQFMFVFCVGSHQNSRQKVWEEQILTIRMIVLEE